MASETIQSKKRHEMAFAMFGRGWGACNDAERELVMKEMGRIPRKGMTCARLSNGAYRCTAMVGGRLLHRDYYGWRKAAAISHFMNNPPE